MKLIKNRQLKDKEIEKLGVSNPEILKKHSKVLEQFFLDEINLDILDYLIRKKDSNIQKQEIKKEKKVYFERLAKIKPLFYVGYRNDYCEFFNIPLEKREKTKIALSNMLRRMDLGNKHIVDNLEKMLSLLPHSAL